MKLTLKSGIVAALGSAAAIAVATTWGPFLMSTYRPDLTYEGDRETNFVAAGNLPRHVMQTSVQNIKAGDVVRIIYANGAIYDFSISARCSYVNSTACQVESATQVGQLTDPSDPSPSAIRAALRDEYGPDFFRMGCNGGGGTYGPTDTVAVQTGYWSSEFVVYGPNTFGTTATWRDTGIVHILVASYAPYLAPGPENCR
jgi:hypothetical protein